MRIAVVNSVYAETSYPRWEMFTVHWHQQTQLHVYLMFLKPMEMEIFFFFTFFFWGGEGRGVVQNVFTEWQKEYR